MNNEYLENWIKLVSEPNEALRDDMGTAIWIDGLRALEDLEVASFFKAPQALNLKEEYALNLLKIATEEHRPEEDFRVSGHANLMYHSKLYKKINSRNTTQGILYRFVTEKMGDFSPWIDTITLGTNFYSIINAKIRIPFYTFNHENTHLKVFKGIYSDIDLSDSDLVQLFILSEWFCISTDLILAYDLLQGQQIGCFTELGRVPFKQGGENIFSYICTSIRDIDSFAGQFRQTFLDLKIDASVFDLISRPTLQFHRQYAQNNLLPKAREIPAKMGRIEASDLLAQLRSSNFSDLISDLIGVQYV